jgi:thioredoxin reductase (NADPH)
LRRSIIPSEQLRALMIAEAELGERIMRALILRRVAILQAAIGGPEADQCPLLAQIGHAYGLN